MSGTSVGVEPDSDSKHQAVWLFELIELVAYMEEEVFRDVCFQCKYLIERIQILSFADEVPAYAEVDGKMGMMNSALAESPAENCSMNGGR